MIQRSTNKPWIVLVGMMGSGKSSVAAALGGSLGMDVLDTDQAIEERAGTSISEIFRAHGEPGFRKIETEVIQALPSTQPLVVATGGGTVTNEDNLRTLLTHGCVIYLACTCETALNRVGDAADRPLLAGETREQQLATLRKLKENREKWYARAHHTVQTDTKSIQEILKEINMLLGVQEGT
jgi:shikimate kinase